MRKPQKPAPKKVRATAKTKKASAVPATVPPASSTFAANRDRLAAMTLVAGRASKFRPPVEVLTPVHAVPTPFVQLDRLTGVGGWPTARVSVVHGPSNEGKTKLMHGVGRGFLARGHFYTLIDAEYTTPMEWVRELLGEFADHPGFRAMRPETYEETVDAVASFCDDVIETKRKGDLPPDMSGIIVVDSIRKLVPKRLLKALEAGADGQVGAPGKKRDVGIDGMGGAGQMYKAALNSQWMDSLVPMLGRSGIGVVLITREIEKQGGGSFFDREDYTVTGGRGVNFDASLRVRVELGRSLVSEGTLIGECHDVVIHKTKVAGKLEKTPTGHYHTSTGVISPVGFDRARDCIELGEEMGVVEVSGAWLSFEGKRLGQGRDNAVHMLSQSPDVLDALEIRLRTEFAPAMKGKQL